MKEEQLYSIMKNLVEQNVPMSFKGAMTLKTVLDSSENNIYRETKDIDANWYGTKPSMDELENIVTKAVKEINPDFSIQIKRAYDDTRSAGFIIHDETGEFYTSIDIQIKENPYIQTYETNGFKFQGSTIEKIIADKVNAVSSPQIMRRTKDLVDLYMIDNFVDFDTEKVAEIILESGKSLGDFSSFLNRKDDLEYAYGKMKGLKNAPDFEELYSDVKSFCSDIKIAVYNKKVERIEKQAEQNKAEKTINRKSITYTGESI